MSLSHHCCSGFMCVDLSLKSNHLSGAAGSKGSKFQTRQRCMFYTFTHTIALAHTLSPEGLSPVCVCVCVWCMEAIWLHGLPARLLHFNRNIRVQYFRHDFLYDLRWPVGLVNRPQPKNSCFSTKSQWKIKWKLSELYCYLIKCKFKLNVIFNSNIQALISYCLL